MLYARRTQLFADSVVDPNYWVPPERSTNRYFESQPPVAVREPSFLSRLYTGNDQLNKTGSGRT
jgi:hypothetical protein